MRQLSSS